MHLATLAIIAANVIISMKGFKDFSFFEKYKFNIGGIRRGEQFRMVSSGFLHLDFSHLLFNMLNELKIWCFLLINKFFGLSKSKKNLIFLTRFGLGVVFK